MAYSLVEVGNLVGEVVGSDLEEVVRSDLEEVVRNGVEVGVMDCKVGEAFPYLEYDYLYDHSLDGEGLFCQCNRSNLPLTPLMVCNQYFFLLQFQEDV